MLNNIIYVLIGITSIYNFYLFITGALGLLRLHKSPIKQHAPKNKFAVLIPARNEEQVIGSLIHSLKTQDYPDELYDIFVIPNNCSDNTKNASIEAGAKVLNCKVPVKNKGDVLRCVFKKLKKNKDIDAYIIFDADNIVDKNFLKRMNDTLCDGYEVAQGNRDSKNPHDSWISAALSIYYWILNLFYNKARMNMHASSTINGTGFMIKKSVIDEDGFDTYTVTEDLEFSARCIINGRKIAYVEDAITYDEQAIKYKTSVIQRKRWTVGNVQCLRLYSKELLKNIFKNFDALDFLIRIFAPFFQVVGTLVPIAGASIALSHLEGIDLQLATMYMLASSMALLIGSIGVFILVTYYYNQFRFSKILLRNHIFPNIYAYMGSNQL